MDAARSGSGTRGRTHADRACRHDHWPGRGGRQHVLGARPSSTRICARGRAFAVTAATLFAPLILNWLWRGQTLQEAAQLTGRTKVWSAIFGLGNARGWKSCSGQGFPTSPSTAYRSTATGLPPTWTKAGSGCSLTQRSSWYSVLVAVTHRRGDQACCCAVLGHLLPRGLDQRDGPWRRVPLPAQPCRGGIAAGRPDKRGSRR